MSQEQQIKNDYSNYIHASKYARWLEDKGRRETWEETVTRYCNFIKDRAVELCPDGNMDEYIERTVFPAIYNKQVMPSMRALMTAGEAAHRDNMAVYNCAYMEVDDPKVFDEMLYVLMCGTGMGFSVERQYVSQLPEVPSAFYASDTTVVVRDSKMGWATALRETISLLYAGKIPVFDLTKLRPAGARLRTFGGRSSGPEPLADLLKFTVDTFVKAKGRKLTSIECHDLCCKIAQSVVVGGVRRSALISLSNLTDMRMRNAKQGEWYYVEPQRALANNSVCYTEKPDIGIFMDEWKSLYESKAGERGIFNRTAADKLIPPRRRELGQFNWGTNP